MQVQHSPKDVVETIVTGVNSACVCGFRVEHVTDRELRCHPASPESVVLQARLLNAPGANVSELYAKLQEWASTNRSFPLQPHPLSLESVCSLAPDTPLEWCAPYTTLNTPPRPTTTSSSVPTPQGTISQGTYTPTTAPSGPTLPLVTIIVVGSMVFLLALAIIVTLVVVIIALVSCGRRRKIR